MPAILAIETATTNCSVAIIQTENNQIFHKSVNNGYSHAENLTPFIEELMNENKISFSQLHAIAISKGPGSYTGLRIGTSTAKGLCYALDIPLIGIDTLQAMAFGISDNSYDFLIPMIDARRMEVYTAVYNNQKQCLESVHPKILDENSFSDILDKGKTLFFGNGAEKFKKILSHNNAHFDLSNNLPNAIPVAQLAANQYQNQQFENLAYFEPQYIKAFQATTPKKQI
jgi:tRNA threonylcarbamoyladenosine biosynthesis protein TsaB